MRKHANKKVPSMFLCVECFTVANVQVFASGKLNSRGQ